MRGLVDRRILTEPLTHTLIPAVSSLRITGSIYIGVRDLNAALAWYMEKFELRKSPEPIDEETGDAALVSADGEAFIAFGAPNPANVETRMFAVKNAQKAREWLASRGVNAGPLQTDRQGTHYFEMRDLEDNMIEFCEEP
jgi:hypothetical protein